MLQLLADPSSMPCYNGSTTSEVGARNLLAQVPIVHFLGFDLHAGVVPLDRKVAGLVFSILISHHRLVIDPELNVRAYRSDAITQPFAVFGEQFRCFAD